MSLNNNQTNGATIIEINVIIIVFIIIILSTYYFGVCGILGSIIFIFLIYYSIVLMDKIRPSRPTCLKGVCRAKDYAWEEITDEGIYFTCRCGIKYIRKRDDKKFMVVLPDGSFKPYMKNSLLHGWRIDSGGNGKDK